MSIINTIKGMIGKKRTVEKAGYTEKIKKSGVPFVLDNSLIGELKEGDLVAGRYTILNVMKGGMGVVYPAYDNALMQVFAIKTFQERFMWNQNIINRFIREAEVWMNLDEHPNITRAMSIQKDHGIPYIILEYVDGGDLSKWIGNLDIPQAINFAVQICNGMAYAYDKLRLVHRDLKPRNILITGGKIAKITDFGLVKVFDDAYTSETSPDAKERLENEFPMIKRGMGVGTKEYMSPEQFLDTKNVGTESDIYSFGVMLYEMLTGARPFHATSFEDYMQKHTKEQPRPPSTINRKIPKELDTVVMRCLQKEPINRYPSFRQLKKELTEIYENITEKTLKVEQPIIQESAEKWNFKGEAMVNIGKYEAAIACLDEALKINPNFDYAWNNKGNALSGLGRYEDAITCYDKALEINSNLGEAWLNKGQVFIHLGRYEDAIVCYDKALEIDSISGAVWYGKDKAWFGKGHALHNLGRHEKAIACYDKALEINPKHEGAWLSKGAFFADLLGRYEDAIACYDKALEINPRMKEAWYNKGIALDNLGKPWDAIACFDKALEIDPKDEWAWYDKGVAFRGLLMLEDAIVCYDNALEIKPNFEDAWLNKGVALSILGRYEDAIACFNHLIEINREDERAWTNKGSVFLDIGKYEDALTCFEQALKINPENKIAKQAKDFILCNFQR